MDKDSTNEHNKSIQNSASLSVFYNNSNLSFIHKKAEKITTAVYLVTNHLSDSEPIKWRIRSSSLDLIKDILGLQSNFSDNFLVPDNLKQKIMALVSFMDLLNTAGFISTMNHGVLKEELIKLAGFLGPKYSLEHSPEPHFPKDFFSILEYAPSERTYGDLQTEKIDQYVFERESQLYGQLKGHYKGQYSKEHMSFIKESLNNKDKGQDTKRQKSGSERKQAILALIKSKKKVNIKDISIFIKDYSDKTLQRDLTAMVKAGVLKKEGERRWSQYLLA